jgi:hypothetical protein
MSYERAKATKRTRGEDAVPVPSHTARYVPKDVRKINGWGADLDPADRPSVPHELPSNVMTARGEVKHRQTPRTKIYISNEMPDLTPVFGETVPPHGLSGMLRDFAFQYGEGTSRHWMTLMLADRIDRVESAFPDGDGRGITTILSVAGAVVGLAILVAASNRKERRDSRLTPPAPRAGSAPARPSPARSQRNGRSGRSIAAG